MPSPARPAKPPLRGLVGASTALAASDAAIEFDAAKVDQVKQAIREG